MNSSTELSTGFRGNRWSMGIPDLRVGREGLKPTVDINVVEPNVPRHRNSVLQRTERRSQNHVLGEFGASTARYEVFLVETELHSSNTNHSVRLCFGQLYRNCTAFMICLWEEKRREEDVTLCQHFSLVLAMQTKSHAAMFFWPAQGESGSDTNSFSNAVILKLKIIYFALYFS